uniref:Uncharacterized protein LOC111101702 n=1 Tax=Crassostrea virginica TaxID=6565 RepID=A0A8B8AFN8_CRAVI|nr:uncharacterized protein LOC111101702 [Crassostrea virginica]
MIFPFTKEGFMNKLIVVMIHCLVISTRNVGGVCINTTAIRLVPECPTNDEEWEKAARQKHCTAHFDECQNHKKGALIYHCVVLRNTSRLVDLCGRIWYSPGHCVDFNIENQRIESNFEKNCTPECANPFDSSKIYKYRSCYPEKDEEKTTFRKKPSSTINSTEHSCTDQIFLIMSLTVNVLAIILIIVLSGIYMFLERKLKNYTMDRHRNRHEPGDISLNDIELTATSRTEQWRI